jgi:hypothetical protein
MTDFSPLDTDAQEAAQAQRLTEGALAKAKELADVQWLMGDVRGRRVVWSVLDRAGVFRSSFNQDAMVMAFAEGRRNEGLRMLALIESAAPESYILIQQEARK